MDCWQPYFLPMVIKFLPRFVVYSFIFCASFGCSDPIIEKKPNDLKIVGSSIDNLIPLNDFNLEELIKGRPSIIQYVNVDCGNCLKSLMDWKNFLQRYDDLDVNLIIIGFGTFPDQIKYYYNEYDFEFPAFFDIEMSFYFWRLNEKIEMNGPLIFSEFIIINEKGKMGHGKLNLGDMSNSKEYYDAILDFLN
jgi:hypothetical protein